ncbi:MAG: RNA 2',3'-cyclic phosphodiesterase [Syntrophales bacterium]|nr:RNA 2',3'-cyclic phosphodiesterase [Syntrophales bacterium]
MNEAKGIRAFLAIDPPESVRQEMAHIQERLKKTIQGAISWTRPAGIHLTLKFFGDIAEGDIEFLSDVIKSRITDVEPFSLEVKNLGVFPNVRRPRVIWLGTIGDIERLDILQKNLDIGFADLGFERDDRPFRAHWTLGRIKATQGLVGMDRAMEKGAGLTAGAFTASSLILFRSELQPQGAVYTRLAEYPLAG